MQSIRVACTTGDHPSIESNIYLTSVNAINQFVRRVPLETPPLHGSSWSEDSHLAAPIGPKRQRYRSESGRSATKMGSRQHPFGFILSHFGPHWNHPIPVCTRRHIYKNHSGSFLTKGGVVKNRFEFIFLHFGHLGIHRKLGGRGHRYTFSLGCPAQTFCCAGYLGEWASEKSENL